MRQLFLSATKFVLVLFAVILSVAFFITTVKNLNDHDIAINIIGLFSNVMIAVVSFYFGQKNMNTPAGA